MRNGRPSNHSCQKKEELRNLGDADLVLSMFRSLPSEFSLIAKYFRPLAGPGSLELRDDAALLRPPVGRDLVLTVDAMIAGVHFLPDDPPDLIGRKLLRVNLSDLAAKVRRFFCWPRG